MGIKSKMGLLFSGHFRKKSKFSLEPKEAQPGAANTDTILHELRSCFFVFVVVNVYFTLLERGSLMLEVGAFVTLYTSVRHLHGRGN